MGWGPFRWNRSEALERGLFAQTIQVRFVEFGFRPMIDAISKISAPTGCSATGTSDLASL